MYTSDSHQGLVSTDNCRGFDVENDVRSENRRPGGHDGTRTRTSTG